MEFDYIIIGSGIAGLNTALQASKKGSVLVITKKKLEDCNTFYAQGGIAAVISPKDSFKKHVEDTMKAGCYHNYTDAVNFIIKKGPAAIKRLLSLGVKFSEDSNGETSLGREGGHQENRIVHSGDYSGKAIEQALIQNIKRNSKITVFENTFAQDFLVIQKICYGVKIIRKNRQEKIFGKHVIIASGGLGQIYKHTTNPSVATGDGIAMAYRAGCKIKDLEFIQFHPTAFKEKKSPQFLISEAVRGEGAVLRNSDQERFMLKYDKNGELAPRDIVSRAIFKEEKKGLVYLDMRQAERILSSKKYEKKIQTEFPQIFAYLKDKNLNLAEDLIPITPVAHFSCGGVETNLKGQTSIQNLYAFGEAACTGLHGANRLASNSLLEGLVMSNEILTATNNTNQLGLMSAEKNPVSSLSKNKTISTVKIRKDLQKIMWGKVGIVRNKKDMTLAIKEIKDLQKKLLSLKSLQTIENFETANMVLVGLLISKSALKRGKSIGTHYLEPQSLPFRGKQKIAHTLTKKTQSLA